MNFNGVEMERKRIANDIHDQVGYNIMQVKNALHEATKKATTFN
jgi:signal transduction histidine kinase